MIHTYLLPVLGVLLVLILVTHIIGCRVNRQLEKEKRRYLARLKRYQAELDREEAEKKEAETCGE